MTRDPTPYTRWRFLRPYRSRLAVVFGVLSVSTFLGLLTPWFLEQLIDNIILPNRHELLWVFAGGVFTVAVLRFAMGTLQSYVYASVTARILFDLRRDFLEHLQRLSPRFFTRTRFGEISSRFNRDISAVQEIATGALLSFLSNSLRLIGSAAFALYYSWELFLLGVAPFPVALWIARRFRGPIKRLTEKLRQTAADLSSFVVETITGMRTVRALGQERAELGRFSHLGQQLIRQVLSFQLTQSLAGGLPRLCLVVSTVVVYSLGAYWVIDNRLELGDLVAIGMYMGMLFAPLQSVVDLYLQLVQARVAIGRVLEIRELEPEVAEDPDARLPAEPRGEIVFEDVVFSYEPDEPLLQGVCFEISPGERVALIGRSGAGKSTIIDLLYRFYDPQSGVVRVDGDDLREVRISRVREKLAVVSQELFLFHGTLLENVLFGAPGAGRGEAEAVAEEVGLVELVRRSPDGWDTLVGERGTRLSGGERQRVAIARALLRHPTILVLDEATAALDLASDRKIRDALRRLAERSTLLVITHRPQPIADVDRVLVLEGGRIVQEGSPLELADTPGVFRELLHEGSEEDR